MVEVFDVSSIVTSLVTCAVGGIAGALSVKVSCYKGEREELSKLPEKVGELADKVESISDQVARLVRHDASDDEALRELLYDRIKQGYRFYRERGWCSAEEKKDFQMLYDQYHEKGGNGFADHSYGYVMAMPENEEEHLLLTKEE